MKICLFDNWKKKFSWYLERHWQELGHEVEYSMGYGAHIVERSDASFFEVCDTNIRVASREKPQKNGPVVDRCIDIDAWAKHYGGVEWDWVDHLIFIAPHIKRLVEEKMEGFYKYPNLERHVIPMGIRVDDWEFRDHRKQGNKVAWIARVWGAKGPQLIVQLMAKLEGWDLHSLGAWGQPYIEPYIKDLVERLDLSWHHTISVDSVDEWLDDKDLLIVPSMKEAFSYVAAEAMAKGIPVLIHRFYGAGDLWPEWVLFDTVDEAVDKVRGGLREPKFYRDFIGDTYPESKMCEAIDRLMGI